MTGAIGDNFTLACTGAKSIRMEVWIISLDAREDRRLTAKEGWTRDARWSPDGQSIAYQLSLIHI